MDNNIENDDKNFDVVEVPEIGDIQEIEVDELENQELQDTTSDTDEEYDDDSEEEESDSKNYEKKGKTSFLKEKLRQEQREKFQALHALNELKRRKDELEHEVALNAEAAYRNYYENLDNEIDKLTKEKIKAREVDDHDAEFEIDNILLEKKAQKMKMNDFVSGQNYLQNQNRINQQLDAQYFANYRQNNVDKFKAENSWVDPKSNDFDQNVANAYNYYCGVYAKQLADNGYADYILSEPFLNVAKDEVINYLKSNMNRNGNGELKMKSSRYPISPARSSSYGNSHRGKVKVVLSDNDKDYCRINNLNPQIFAINKLALMREKKLTLNKGD